MPILLAICGLIIGGLAGFLIASRKNREAQARADAAEHVEQELRNQIQQRESELNETREKLSSAERAYAAAETVGSRLPALEDLVRSNQAALATEQARAAAAEAHAEAATQRVNEQQEHHTKALADLRAAQEKSVGELRDAFAALSAQALKETHPQFLQLANQAFEKLAKSAEGDLKTREEAIKGLVAPLQKQLDDYQKRLQTTETEQNKTLGAVKQQLDAMLGQSQTLAKETNQLRLVLSSNQARGRWGEETLRRVVEAAGMSRHCDYDVQVQEGESKPDMVVKVPGERLIIVDSKVPDLDFLGALATADETSRSDKLRAHAAKLKQTIRDLGARNYPKQFPNSLDRVVLFVPAESLLSAALEGDPELIVDAGSLGILLATPSSLIALLYAVAMSWQQDAQSRNAREIGEAGKELFERVTKFFEHFENIREGLEKAGKAYNAAIGSYDTRVKPSREKLIKLAGGLADANLSELKPVDTALRSLPEMKE